MLMPQTSADLPSGAPGIFEGLLGQAARETLAGIGFVSFSPSSAQDVSGYIRHFGDLWLKGSGEAGPDTQAVLRSMSERESALYDLWRLALRNDFSDHVCPLVAQSPVAMTASPFILRSSKLNRPVVVMSEGLWSFVCAAVMGVLHWAEGSGSRESFGLELFRRAARAWVSNRPPDGPGGVAMAEAVTADMETGEFGVGLADAVFTWAFLHEMGHYALGHLPVGEVVRGMSAETGLSAVQLCYDQECELAADAYGFERYLGLMPLAQEIRRSLRFGPQIDHAPIVAFDLIDLACRLFDPRALAGSTTHPPPLVRRFRLAAAYGSRLSAEGREWYEYWEERFEAFKVVVLEGCESAGDCRAGH